MDTVATECGVCCEGYNLKNHKRIDCSYCDFNSCRECTQKYITSTANDAHCMSCKTVWSREFIVDSCTKKFCNTEYKEHRETILLEREKCLLPQTQELVVRKRQENNLSDLIHDTRKEIENLRDTQYNLENQLIRLRNGYDIGTHTQKKTFVRKCPTENCKGFLGSDWKCDLCEVKVCSKCNEPDTGDDHECDPNNVETAKLLARDTKPCPSCGTMIFKISGCNQMWCPECHTAFDWRSGVIETGIVHNPHFYEFQRDTGGGQANRNHGDIPCGGAPTIGELINFFHPNRRTYNPRGYYYNTPVTPTSETETNLMYIHRVTAHCQAYELPQYREIAVNNSDLRVDYLMNILPEENWRILLQKREKTQHKHRDINNLLRMFVDTTGDYFRQLIVKEVTPEECFDILDKLVEYFNTNMIIIHKRYNCVTPWIVKNAKYNVIHRTYKGNEGL